MCRTLLQLSDPRFCAHPAAIQRNYAKPIQSRLKVVHVYSPPTLASLAN
jgi:hypothetical protein